MHLETLELVSSQCEVKVESLLNTIHEDKFITLKDDLLAITQIFKSIEEDSDEEAEIIEHDFQQLVSDHIDSLAITLDSEKVIQVACRFVWNLKKCLIILELRVGCIHLLVIICMLI